MKEPRRTMKRAGEEIDEVSPSRQKVSAAPIFDEVVQYVVDNGWLSHWSDMVALTAVNKTCHCNFSSQKKESLLVLLAHLDGICKSNVHQHCGNVFAPESLRECSCALAGARPENQTLAPYDPRYKANYDYLEVHEKCAAMVEFLSFVVDNMQDEFNFDDLTEDVVTNEDGHPGDWYQILGEKPKLGALILNVAVLAEAQEAIKSGEDCRFNDAMLGEGPICIWGSSSGTILVLNNMHAMLPFQDIDIIKYLQNHVYPSTEDLELLGPSLTKKIVFLAPLFELVPPGNMSPTLLEGLELEEI